MNNDAPLQDTKEDVLGRAQFAEDLAKSIINLDASQGFVYGLYGVWGSGKSTIINFMESYLEKHNGSIKKNPKKHNQEKPQSKVFIFRFNPWMCSGSEKITQIFFQQLQIRLKMPDIPNLNEEFEKS